MISPGDVISHTTMCQEENFNLQQGMNFKIHGKTSVLLMSVRPNAPYADKIENDGTVLIYEGHDAPKDTTKHFDQPLSSPKGSPTQNGKFMKAARDYKKGLMSSEVVKVYEKVRPGVWVFTGVFNLTDGWQEDSSGRTVCKFKLELTNGGSSLAQKSQTDLEHNRVIPTAVKIAVWKRDEGKCVACGSRNNLHFDHILPFSLGGTSLSEQNIQLLCAKHNLEKSDSII